MCYKIGEDKYQLELLPARLEDYVSKNHICRVIYAFIQQLDMSSLGFKYAECKETGNRPYDPRMMLGLYIYGYLHRVRSSRRLEAETHRNVEVMWLMESLRPDDKTISNFRKDNSKALRKSFREYTRMCQALQLYGAELEATDSVKFRANNSRKNNHNKITVERELARIDKQINDYMNELDQADKEEAEEKKPSAEAIKAALELLKKRQVKFQALQERVAEEGEVSTVDPDARLMHSGGDARPLDVCYNVQTVVDSKHHLIVDFDIADSASDKGNLHALSEKAKEVLEVETLTNLADKGYYDGEDIAACESSGTTCLVAKPKPGGVEKPEGFRRDSFVYDREKDCYVCPGNNCLKYMRNQKHSDGVECRVYENFPACSQCELRSKCTTSSHRKIIRRPHEDVLEIVNERTRSNKELYRKRQQIVEHPFGTIKSVWGYKQFLCRTKPKVIAETALAYLAYNMRRVFNIFEENGDILALIYR